MGTVGDKFPIWVPDKSSSLTPLATPFTNLANSVSDQLDHLKAQSISIVTDATCFTPGGGWSVLGQKISVAAEVMASVYLELKRTGGKLNVDDQGNVANTPLGTMNSAYNAQSTVPLSSGASRGCFGWINSSGTVTLAYVSGTDDIATGDSISLGGSFVLNNPLPSGL